MMHALLNIGNVVQGDPWFEGYWCWERRGYFNAMLLGEAWLRWKSAPDVSQTISRVDIDEYASILN